MRHNVSDEEEEEAGSQQMMEICAWCRHGVYLANVATGMQQLHLIGREHGVPALIVTAKKKECC
jgi:hypothetical protein